ncbi:hypothetical protein MRX96_005664 [Rhipicephalus microplus]
MRSSPECRPHAFRWDSSKANANGEEVQSIRSRSALAIPSQATTTRQLDSWRSILQKQSRKPLVGTSRPGITKRDRRITRSLWNQKPEEFRSHVVSEGPRPADYHSQHDSTRRRPSLWNPMVNQAKPPLQGLNVQAAASQASYIVPNYVRAPEVPPEPRFISMQMVSIGALTVLITVAIIAWTVVTLRQSDVLKEPAAQHKTGLEDTTEWSVSHHVLKLFRGSNSTMEFSGNATSSSEKSTISNGGDVKMPVVTKNNIA